MQPRYIQPAWLEQCLHWQLSGSTALQLETRPNGADLFMLELRHAGLVTLFTRKYFMQMEKRD
jgi:hypothetical protein